MNLKEWSHDKKNFSSHDRKCFLCHSLVPPFYRGEWVRGWGGGGWGVNLKIFKKGWKYGAGAGLLKKGEAGTFPI